MLETEPPCVPAWAGHTPRRWQSEALPLALASIRARDRGVVSAIMGAGKSRLQAEICASGKGRVLLTVPTVALVEQMAATLQERCPGEVGRYYTDAKQPDKRITVCCMPSVPSLVNRPDWQPPALWIADEAHRTESATILATYAKMAPKSAIAFTATPFRAKRSEELSLWSREVYVYGAADAMRDGVVVPFRQVPWLGKDGVDVTTATIEMIKSAAQGPGLVNATSIDDAETCAAQLSRHQVRAQAVHSRLDRQTVGARLAALKSGELACLVHVNMLTEGVDLPWLRWLAMRRPTRSKVRFCQEVGRVLRAFPGKTDALLLDPMDLLGRFSLTYQAILEGMAAEPSPLEAELLEAEAEVDDDDDEPPSGVLRVESAKRMAAWRKYLRALYFAALGAGLVQFRTASSDWRRNRPSEKQLGAVRHALAGLSRDTTVPMRHRQMLALIGRHAGQMLRGDVSDLMSVGFLIRDGRKEGRDVWAQLTAAEPADGGGDR